MGARTLQDVGWRRLLLGQASFGEGEEYMAFKYTFALLMLWVTLPLLALFILGDAAGVNRVGWHGLTIRLYFVLCACLIWLLRGRRRWFHPVVWVFAVASWAVHVSGFVFVPDDENRLVWFLSLVVGVYILLGRRAGACLAVASVAAVLWCNPHLAHPVSERGMGTFITSLVSMSVIFHVFTSRSVLFHRAMVASQAQLRELSDRDPLTGVLNSRGLARQCEQLLLLARRRGEPCAVLFVDLDHFKRVNDQHGHDAGDVVLQRVAAVLTQRLRRSDVLGRVGGEEFVVFLPATDEAGATQLAEALRQDIEACCPQTPAGVSLTVTASIGVAAKVSGQVSLPDLQRDADQAMYAAKAGGRNRVSVLGLG